MTAMPGKPARRRVVLHVGTPKSGTTFLQWQLHLNRELLRASGYLYPGDLPSHFLHTMDLRKRGFDGRRYEGAEGAWDRLRAEVDAFDGPALVSHEMLGGIKRPMIERAQASFPDRELRVVVTCRDLGRQLPALWQERVKNGATFSFTEFLDRAEQQWREGPGRGIPWAGQNIAAIARRWGGVVGPENVVLVTVPPSGSPPGELWPRFAEAAGLDVEIELEKRGSNESMGTAEVELLRRINARLPEDLPFSDHPEHIKWHFAQQRLAGKSAVGPVSVPPERRPAFDAIAATMLDQVATEGYRVVGDLSDLRPAYRDGTPPDAVADAAIADLAVEQLVALLVQDREGRRQQSPPPASLPQRAARRVARRLRRGSAG